MIDRSVDEKNLHRLSALSDGIFAIAMTLLVLDIRVTPDLDPAGFRHMLHDLLPKIAAYALSFTILAGFWRDHRRILRLAQWMDTPTVWLTLAGLGVIALLPFPTTMLSEYASQPPAVVVYACTVIVIDVLQLAVFFSIRRHPEMARPVPPHFNRNFVMDLGSTILVFGVTVPIAFFSPAAALWTWLALVPLKFVLGRHERARAGQDAEQDTR